MLVIDRLTDSELACRIRIPTARDAAFPRTVLAESRVSMQLPPRYPFERPLVKFQTPIWNPNVFSGGRLCYGEWKLMEYLDLFLLRLMKVVALDPSIINVLSPANASAAAWYRSMLIAHPERFPTRNVERLLTRPAQPRLEWRTIR